MVKLGIGSILLTPFGCTSMVGDGGFYSLEREGLLFFVATAFLGAIYEVVKGDD